jgi:ADP-L-glycero-D-manno-heptose 6-epimerase
MDRNDVILVTGAAGFIGSCMVGYLNRKGFQNIIIADDFSRDDKRLNYQGKKICARVDRDELFDWLSRYQMRIDFVFHLGARTDTTEFDYSIHERLNVEYSKKIWNYCTEKNIPLVYASSAATYGSGELGYKDDHSIVEQLQPLNPYGVSKNEFDKWVLKQTTHPPFWAGLKFFNVYGPNEYHKGRMASVIFHAYNQIKSTGKVKLFKSHKPEYKDGEQLRDFVYVKDVVDICQWLMQHQPASGLYNLGTGKARTFKDLVTAIFTSLKLEPNIQYIDTPEDIRDKYQYFTEADMNKLHKAGYKQDFYSLEDGVNTYVQHFLQGEKYY